MKQTDIDRFICKIQVGSRVAIRGKIVHIEPVRDTLTFDMRPSKSRYNDCIARFHIRGSLLATYQTSA